MNVLKKFTQLNMLATAGVIFVVAGIVLAFGAKVTNEISAEMTSNSVAQQAANWSTDGVGKLAKYLPLLALVVAAAIIISVVVGAFRTGGK